MNSRLVKVRVNSSGTRWIGYAELREGIHRTSDLLNSPDPYVLVREDERSELHESGFRAILKDSISYVEALEEPGSPESLRLEGAYTWLNLQLKVPIVRMQGELFVPKRKTPYDVVNDARRFISLRNVHFHQSVERYDYLAVGKRLTSIIEWTPGEAAPADV